MGGDQYPRTGGYSQRQRDKYFNQGYCYRRRSHGLPLQAVANENTVHDGVDRVKQQPNHLGNRIAEK